MAPKAVIAMKKIRDENAETGVDDIKESYEKA
jgi:hypothetical protein